MEVEAPWANEAADQALPDNGGSLMTKRILLALTLAGALGGGILACNTPAATTTPLSSPAASTPAAGGSVETPSESPSESPSAEPSAS